MTLEKFHQAIRRLPLFGGPDPEKTTRLEEETDDIGSTRWALSWDGRAVEVPSLEYVRRIRASYEESKR